MTSLHNAPMSLVKMVQVKYNLDFKLEFELIFFLSELSTLLSTFLVYNHLFSEFIVNARFYLPGFSPYQFGCLSTD